MHWVKICLVYLGISGQYLSRNYESENDRFLKFYGKVHNLSSIIWSLNRKKAKSSRHFWTTWWSCRRAASFVSSVGMGSFEIESSSGFETSRRSTSFWCKRVRSFVCLFLFVCRRRPKTYLSNNKIFFINFSKSKRSFLKVLNNFICFLLM